jgi:hypothetical protein
LLEREGRYKKEENAQGSKYIKETKADKRPTNNR